MKKAMMIVTLTALTILAVACAGNDNKAEDNQNNGEANTNNEIVEDNTAEENVEKLEEDTNENVVTEEETMDLSSLDREEEIIVEYYDLYNSEDLSKVSEFSNEYIMSYFSAIVEGAFQERIENDNLEEITVLKIQSVEVDDLTDLNPDYEDVKFVWASLENEDEQYEVIHIFSSDEGPYKFALELSEDTEEYKELIYLFE